MLIIAVWSSPGIIDVLPFHCVTHTLIHAHTHHTFTFDYTGIPAYFCPPVHTHTVPHITHCRLLHTQLLTQWFKEVLLNCHSHTRTHTHTLTHTFAHTLYTLTHTHTPCMKAHIMTAVPKRQLTDKNACQSLVLNDANLKTKKGEPTLNNAWTTPHGNSTQQAPE